MDDYILMDILTDVFETENFFKDNKKDKCLITYAGVFAKQKGISYKSKNFKILCGFAEWLEKELGFCKYKKEG